MRIKHMLKKGIIYIWTVIVFGFCLISFLAYCSEHWMFKTWANLSADELIYTITSPLDGTNTDMIKDYFSYCGTPMILLFCLLAIAAVQYHVRGGGVKYYRFGICFLLVFSITALASAGYEVYSKLDLKDYTASQSTYSTFIDENYVAPDSVGIEFPEQKKNLIYIFLESMEMTYADKEDGGSFEKGCIPELTKLAKENEDFSGKSKQLNGAITLPGATWTMGGLFAQTSGIPLQVSIDVNSMDTQEHFFPGITTLGDILEEEGYSQSLLFGTDATFGGRRLFFTEHGKYDVIDYNYALESGMIPPGYKVWWGFEDHKLFEFAKERLTQMDEEGKPFNLTMLTVDTHFEDGAPCEYCRDDYGEQYADVMACSSRHVDEFVKWVQEQPFYKDTAIVICGDHLTMDSDFCKDVPRDYQRRVYTTYINAAAENKDDGERLYSTFDMFPTTLAALGAVVEGDRLGLGTNLFSGTPTLTEVYGAERERTEISKKSELMEQLADVDESSERYKARAHQLEVNADRKEKDKNNIIYADVHLGDYDENAGAVPVTINNFHNTEKGIQSVVIAVWTKEDQSDLIWYQMGMVEEGMYTVGIQLADWNYQKGNYMIDSYEIDGTGEATMLNRRVAEVD